MKAGDFDSLGYIPADALVYPSRKNFTDGEIALDYLLTHGCTEIELYGGGGGRDDIFTATCAFCTPRSCAASPRA